MTLNQYQSLNLWHTHHSRERPFEKNAWEAIVTLWVMGWVGGVVTLLLGLPMAGLLCLALVFLPGAYVSWRVRMHKAGRLRCDWLTALR
jgi:hypothetical protein